MRFVRFLPQSNPGKSCSPVGLASRLPIIRPCRPRIRTTRFYVCPVSPRSQTFNPQPPPCPLMFNIVRGGASGRKTIYAPVSHSPVVQPVSPHGVVIAIRNVNWHTRLIFCRILNKYIQ